MTPSVDLRALCSGTQLRHAGAQRPAQLPEPTQRRRTAARANAHRANAQLPEPTHAEPTHTEPTHTEPTLTEPTHTEPTQRRRTLHVRLRVAEHVRDGTGQVCAAVNRPERLRACVAWRGAHPDETRVGS